MALGLASHEPREGSQLGLLFAIFVSKRLRAHSLLVTKLLRLRAIFCITAIIDIAATASEGKTEREASASSIFLLSTVEFSRSSITGTPSLVGYVCLLKRICILWRSKRAGSCSAEGTMLSNVLSAHLSCASGARSARTRGAASRTRRRPEDRGRGRHSASSSAT